MRNRRSGFAAGRSRRLSLTVMIILVAASLVGTGLVTATATPPTTQALAGGVTYPPAVMFSGYPVGDSHFMGFPSLYNGSSTNGVAVGGVPEQVAGAPDALAGSALTAEASCSPPTARPIPRA